MTVELRDITRDNWRQCVRLKVRDDQKAFVAPNAVSLAQAAYETWWLPQGVYNGENMVGFVMYSRVGDPKWGWWICRLMVDQTHQRKGYGRAAIMEILRRLRNRDGCREVFISEAPQNKVASALYESLGFVKTGEIVDGEEVHKYIFPEP